MELDETALMERIHNSVSVDEAAGIVAEEIGYGAISEVEPLLVGYDEVNCRVLAENGQFLLKLFSKDKTLEEIQSNVRAVEIYEQAGVPTPKLLESPDGQRLFSFGTPAIHAIALEFRSEKVFADDPPALADKIALAKGLAQLHTKAELYETDNQYDRWLPENLVNEFEDKSHFLAADSLALIEPVVKALSELSLVGFSRAMCHLDLHRENAFNLADGFLIIDLATTQESYVVYDLACFLAIFCSEPDLDGATNEAIYAEIIDAYCEVNPLSAEERASLPILIRASLSSNILLPEYLKASGTDPNPGGSAYYHSIGHGVLTALSR